GQTEVCHLWNLLAEETREGEVYLTLLRKLERERAALGGAVFDVLGKALAGKALRQLMIEAVRYGDQPEVRARLAEVVEGALDQARLRELLDERALAHDVMDASRVGAIRREMERLAARKLQPHYIASFFKEVFQHLGGTLREREAGRYEITHVPAVIRQRSETLTLRETILPRYERVCFEKESRQLPGKPEAALLTPGHALLAGVVDLLLERHRDLMKQGAILVDESDPGETMRALFYLEHAIQDGRPTPGGGRHVVSQRLQFVEIPLGSDDATPQHAGYAPYLDYRPLAEGEQGLLASAVAEVLSTQALEEVAVAYAIRTLVPEHLREVRQVKPALIDKTRAAVHARLTKEINHWDHRAEELKAAESAGRPNAKLNSGLARQRADELQGRYQRRMEELDQGSGSVTP
nr:RNA helicase [Ardenticatenales bacterium]